MKKSLIAMLIPILLAGCQNMPVENVSEVDTGNKQSSCVSECKYLDSEDAGEAFGKKSFGNAYKVCINNCPTTDSEGSADSSKKWYIRKSVSSYN